jgi:NagD protein
MATPKNYIIDMDGVLISGGTMIPEADRFLERLKARSAEYLVLTNTPTLTPGDLAHRFKTQGLDIPKERIFTSAMATAQFLHAQQQDARAYVIGESGLTEAIHDIAYIITDYDPHFVVLGETNSYDLESVTKAIRLIMAGAKFIATNPDPSGPTESGLVPACGAMAALIEKVTDVPPYFVGKPNPLMNTVMVGDRMDTDIVAGVESGMETILVLTGVTRREDVARFPYRPTQILESVAQIDP